MTVELKTGISAEHVTQLYDDPLISRTGDDAHPAVFIDHELARYISVFANGEFVGAYLLIDFSHYEAEAHCFLLKSATPHSAEISKQFLSLVFSNPAIDRLSGWVREDLTQAANHNLKHGFKFEGRKREAVRVNGIKYDLLLMGITRTDWERNS